MFSKKIINTFKVCFGVICSTVILVSNSFAMITNCGKVEDAPAGTGSNCVAYVRYKLQEDGYEMPSGWTTLKNKIDKINRDFDDPEIGCVAVMRGDPKYGHVAYVENVWDDPETGILMISIFETHWEGHYVSQRYGPLEDFEGKIYGYYDPSL